MTGPAKQLAAAPPDFAARAMERIKANEPELGDSYLWCVRTKLLTEAREEALDLAAWSALLATRLEADALARDYRGRLLDDVLEGIAGVIRVAADADDRLAILQKVLDRP